MICVAKKRSIAFCMKLGCIKAYNGVWDGRV